MVAAPRKGEVYVVDFGTAGEGIDKIRPGVVVSVEIATRHAFHATVAPVRAASGRRRLPMHVFLPAGEAGLIKDSLADVGLVVTVRKEHLGRLLGRLGFASLERLDAALRFYFGV